MQFSRKAAPLLGLASLTALLAAPAANAAPGVFTVVVGTGGLDTTSGGYSGGYDFTTGNTPTTLTALGYYAPNALKANHEIALYSEVGTGSAATLTQIADATVSTGAVGAADNFTYTSTLTKLAGFTGVLAPNTTYRLSAYFGAAVSGATLDPIVGSNPSGSVSGSGGFTYGGPFYGGPGTGLTAPTTYSGFNTFNAYFGPNLQVAAAPEPSQTAALGLGLLGLAGLAVKARRRRVA